jgi:hypothetical protein
MNYDNFLCQQIAKIANMETVKEKCEPDCMFHGEINAGQVKRVLSAWNLLKEEFDKDGTK